MSIYTYLMYLTFTGFHRESFFGEPCWCYFWSLHVSTSKFSDTGCHRRFAKGLSQSWKWTGHERLKLRKLEAWPPAVAAANWRSLAKMKPWRSMISARPTRSRMVTDGHGWSRMVTNGHGSVVWNCENFRVCRKDHAGFQRQKDVMSLQLRLNACAMISLGTPAGSECTRATFWTVTLFLNILNCGRRSSGISVRSVCCSNMMLT